MHGNKFSADFQRVLGKDFYTLIKSRALYKNIVYKVKSAKLCKRGKTALIIKGTTNIRRPFQR